MLLVLLACGAFATEGPTAELPESADLANAPFRADVGGLTATLRADVWRDLMPGDGSHGLIARVDLVGDAPLPADLALERVYVVRGDRVWSAPFTGEERPPRPPNELEKVARDGPWWDDQLRVDVIVRMRTPAGDTAWLASRGEQIGLPQ